MSTSAPLLLYSERSTERPELGGANQYAYHNTNGATAVDMVPLAASSTYRVVYMVTAVNTTGGAVTVTWQVTDGTNIYVVAQQVGLAAGAEFVRNWNGLVLAGPFKLQVVLGGAGAIPCSAHWADPLT